MTWLQFISSMVGSLAWPVCVATIAFVFRTRFSDLLAKLLKVNFPGGFSAEFEKRLSKAEEAATVIDHIEKSPAAASIELSAAITATPSITGTLSATEVGDTAHAEGTVSDVSKGAERSSTGRRIVELRDLARTETNVFDFYEASVAQPAGVVMEAWKLLEAEIVATVERVVPNFEFRKGGGFNVGDLLPLLIDSGVLSRQDAKAVQDLRKLRNLAVHSQEPVNPNEARRFATLAATLGKKLRRLPDAFNE